jgi:hypothetical protein
MDMRKYSGEAFLKVSDVRDGPLQMQIAAIREGRYDKPDAVFETGEALSLNATNRKILVRAYGPDSDDWVGKVIELFLGEIEFQKQMHEAVLVRPVSPPLKAAERTKPAQKRSADFDDEIPSEGGEN